VLISGVWTFPNALLFPIMITRGVEGAVVGPLLVCGIFILTFVFHIKLSIVDIVVLLGSAFLWIISSLWNSYAFALQYNIRIDFLGLFPAMWCSLLAPLACLFRRLKDNKI
jgi:hypothetical protein